MREPQHAGQLRPFMQARFAAAKQALKWSGRLAFASGWLALLLVFLPESWAWLAWCGGVASLLVLLGQQYGDHEFRHSYDDAERIRRIFLLSDSLGRPVPASELAQLRLEFGDLQHDGSAYYTSDLPPGPRRLLSLTWESAFWTRRLQELLATSFWRRASLTTVFFLTAAFAVLAVTSAAVVPKAVIAAFSLLAGLNLWSKWSSCHSTAEACARICRDCEGTLLSGGCGGDELPPVMQVVLDYTAIMASSYPPPDDLYEANREVLNREWEHIRSEVQRRLDAVKAQLDPDTSTASPLEK